MKSMQYLESDEVLYYMDRLDRYTPMTAKFISQDAADVITPLTKEELIPVILGEHEDSRKAISRRLHDAGCSCGGRDYESIMNHDNNHSIYWDKGYVHAIGRQVTFWNLDGDLENVLDEAFAIDDSIGSSLIRSHIFDIINDDEKYMDSLSSNNDLAFIHWLDEKCGELPPAPDMDNYDEDIAQTYYDALDAMIFDPLSEMTKYNDDIKKLIIRTISKDDDAKDLKRDVMYYIIEDIFPLNDKAEGYIVDGYKTMVPNDARRGAVYVGNIVDALKGYDHGLELIEENKVRINSASLGTGAKDNKYPSAMRKGMPSDWLSHCPYEKLRFTPKQKYPDLEKLTIVMMGHDFEVESNAVLNEPDFKAFHSIRSKVACDMGYTHPPPPSPDID